MDVRASVIQIKTIGVEIEKNNEPRRRWRKPNFSKVVRDKCTTETVKELLCVGRNTIRYVSMEYVFHGGRH